MSSLTSTEVDEVPRISTAGGSAYCAVYISDITLMKKMPTL